MALIQWDATMSVGVSEFDKQHQVLIKLINDLNEAMLKGQGMKTVGEIVRELRKYTISHFAYEEKVLEKIAYPQLAAQKVEHTNFVRKIEKFEQDLAEGTVGVAVQVITFLSTWLTKHIRGEDAKYTKFCNENGIR